MSGRGLDNEASLGLSLLSFCELQRGVSGVVLVATDHKALDVSTAPQLGRSGFYTALGLGYIKLRILYLCTFIRCQRREAVQSMVSGLGHQAGPTDSRWCQG